MNVRKRFDLITRTVLFVICLLCSLINLFDNIKEYFEYRYLVTTRLVSSDQVVLPAISICTSNFFDLVKVQRINPELILEFGGQDLNERAVKPKLLRRLNFSQLTSYAYTYDQIVSQCSVYDSQMRSVPCETLGSVRIWYSFDTVCFQLFATRTPATVHRLRYRREDLIELHWILITLHKPVFQKRHVGLLVSRPDVPLQPFYTNPAFVKSSVVNTQTLVVTFLKIRTQQLPAPYKSNCLDYSRTFDGRWISQKNCSFACLIDRMRSLNQMPEFLLVESRPDLGSLHFTNNYSYLLSSCQKACARPDCEEEDFELQVKYEKMTASKHQPTFQVKIVYNYGPEKVILYQPLSTRVQVTSIIAFIFSPLAFWLGISFYHVNNWFIWRTGFIRNLLRRFRAQANRALTLIEK